MNTYSLKHTTCLSLRMRLDLRSFPVVQGCQGYPSLPARQVTRPRQAIPVVLGPRGSRGSYLSLQIKEKGKTLIDYRIHVHVLLKCGVILTFH